MRVEVVEIKGVKCTEHMDEEGRQKEARVFCCPWADRYALANALLAYRPDGRADGEPDRHPDDPSLVCAKVKFWPLSPPRLMADESRCYDTVVVTAYYGPSPTKAIKFREFL